MAIRIYSSFACGNARIRREQQYIQRILYIKGIEFEDIDISDPMHLKDRHFMRTKLIPDDESDDEMKVVLPPQIFKDDIPCGDCQSFFTAVETDSMFSFLELEIPENEYEYYLLHKDDEQNIVIDTESEIKDNSKDIEENKDINDIKQVLEERNDDEFIPKNNEEVDDEMEKEEEKCDYEKEEEINHDEDEKVSDEEKPVPVEKHYLEDEESEPEDDEEEEEAIGQAPQAGVRRDSDSDSEATDSDSD